MITSNLPPAAPEKATAKKKKKKAIAPRPGAGAIGSIGVSLEG